MKRNGKRKFGQKPQDSAFPSRSCRFHFNRSACSFERPVASRQSGTSPTSEGCDQSRLLSRYLLARADRRHKTHLPQDGAQVIVSFLTTGFVPSRGPVSI